VKTSNKNIDHQLLTLVTSQGRAPRLRMERYHQVRFENAQHVALLQALTEPARRRRHGDRILASVQAEETRRQRSGVVLGALQLVDNGEKTPAANAQ